MAAMTAGLQRVAPWVTTAARLGLAGVFGYSGFHKITHPVDSVVAVEAYQLVPSPLVDLVAFGQPFLELCLAILLVAGLATRIAGIGTGVLLVVFIAAVASAWARGLTIDCGCFSGGGVVDEDETHYLRVILRDVGLLALAGWVVAFAPGRLALDRVTTRGWTGGTAPDTG